MMVIVHDRRRISLFDLIVSGLLAASLVASVFCALFLWAELLISAFSFLEKRYESFSKFFRRRLWDAADWVVTKLDDIVIYRNDK